MNFDDLKKQLDKMNNTIENMKQDNDSENQTRKVDERIYKVKPDKAGNVSADIRLLPQTDFSKPWWAKRYNHFIKQNGKYFVEYCYKNKFDNGNCLACEEIPSIWDEYNHHKDMYGPKSQGCEEAKSKINNFKQKEEIWTNILVVKDQMQPEKEGKVFLYAIPKKIFEKVTMMLFPDPKDDLPVRNVYHPTDGRVLRIKGVTNGLVDYSTSFFHESNTPIASSSEKIVEILNKTYNLNDYIVEGRKTEEEISKRFKSFKGSSEDTKPSQSSTNQTINDQKETAIINDMLGDVQEVDMDSIDELFND